MKGTDVKMDHIFQEYARVLSQEEIAPGIFSLRLAAERIASAARPGQFVSLYCRDRQKLLPRPVSLCGIDTQAGALRLVYRVTGPGTGTAEFSRLGAGEQIRILGPLGNGFPLAEASGRRIVLAGGGIGIPPLLAAARALTAGGTRPQVVLGYRDVLFLKEDFEACASVQIATEDGSAGWRGNVLDAMNGAGLEPEVIFACGPRPMLRALAAYAEKRDIPCWISMEERMACGVGACLGCVCETAATDGHSHVHNARVCTDGPVFLSREVIL